MTISSIILFLRLVFGSGSQKKGRILNKNHLHLPCEGSPPVEMDTILGVGAQVAA